jgi:hypothetical protein
VDDGGEMVMMGRNEEANNDYGDEMVMMAK